ncbi:MAG TPA: prepilin peptidase [Holophagaceae bacterium]|nr:prepilin peptidase [Holophagaceae bacterium]
MHFLDLSPWMLSAILAPFGLVVGSFGNVLIHRLPQEEETERNVVTRSSHCPSCKAEIRPWHNIPLFGWLWLRGRCANCGWRIPFRYPLVELLGGLLFGISPWLFPFGTLIWVKGLVCGFVLLVLFFTDLEHMILPDAIQFPLMALGVLLALPQIWWPLRMATVQGPGGLTDFLQVELWHNGLQPAPGWHLFGAPVTWVQSLIGLAVGYGVPALMNRIYMLIRKTEGLGMGDFKMLAWLGAFWGWGPMLGILFLGAGLGSAVGLPLVLLRRAKGQTMLPFGCFLALATPVVVFFGPAIWAWYMGFMG